MKSGRVAIICFALSFMSQFAFAQKADSLTTKRAQGVYFELLGNGGVYSFNYDTRFGNKQDGFGGRIGVSYLAASGDNFFSVPLVINYLAGKNGKYFEAGGGISFYSANVTPFFSERDDRDKASGVFGTLTFGYRSQPVDGGFMFRAGVAPIITSDTFAPYWPYLSFGYSF